MLRNGERAGVGVGRAASERADVRCLVNRIDRAAAIAGNKRAGDRLPLQQLQQLQGAIDVDAATCGHHDDEPVVEVAEQLPHLLDNSGRSPFLLREHGNEHERAEAANTGVFRRHSISEVKGGGAALVSGV